jgi:hypothetical protein
MTWTDVRKFNRDSNLRKVLAQQEFNVANMSFCKVLCSLLEKFVPGWRCDVWFSSEGNMKFTASSKFFQVSSLCQVCALRKLLFLHLNTLRYDVKN